MGGGRHFIFLFIERTDSPNCTNSWFSGPQIPSECAYAPADKNFLIFCFVFINLSVAALAQVYSHTESTKRLMTLTMTTWKKMTSIVQPISLQANSNV